MTSVTYQKHIKRDEPSTIITNKKTDMDIISIFVPQGTLKKFVARHIIS